MKTPRPVDPRFVSERPSLTQIINDIDTVLDENEIDCNVHNDVSIAVLVQYGKLSQEALEWSKRKG